MSIAQTAIPSLIPEGNLGENLYGPRNPTLPVAVQLLQSSFFKDQSLIMAGVVAATIPLVILFIFAGRQLVTGIMQGAVKG